MGRLMSLILFGRHCPQCRLISMCAHLWNALLAAIEDVSKVGGCVA